MPVKRDQVDSLLISILKNELKKISLIIKGSLRSEVRGPTGKIPVSIEEGLRPAEYKLSFTPAVEGDKGLYVDEIIITLVKSAYL